MLRDLWKTIRRAPLPAKLAGGGAAALLLLGATRRAHADPGAAPSALPPAPDRGAPLGAAHADLRPGDRVWLPGAFHLRPTATANAAGLPALPPQVVTIIAPAPSLRRGAHETGYRVRLADGREGFAFVPFDATRV